MGMIAKNIGNGPGTGKVFGQQIGAAQTPSPSASALTSAPSPLPATDQGDPEKRGKASNILAGFLGDSTSSSKRFLGM